MDKRLRMCAWISPARLARFVTLTVGWVVAGGDAMIGCEQAAFGAGP